MGGENLGEVAGRVELMVHFVETGQLISCCSLDIISYTFAQCSAFHSMNFFMINQFRKEEKSLRSAKREKEKLINLKKVTEEEIHLKHILTTETQLLMIKVSRRTFQTCSGVLRSGLLLKIKDNIISR